MVEKTRKLDDALGGDEAPIGPLGGPEPKTREELLDEQRSREPATEEQRPARPTETPAVRRGEEDTSEPQ